MSCTAPTSGYPCCDCCSSWLLADFEHWQRMLTASTVDQRLALSSPSVLANVWASWEPRIVAKEVKYTRL